MSDYINRLEEAIKSLQHLAGDAARAEDEMGHYRLRGKIEGVRLAMSYAVEMHL